MTVSEDFFQINQLIPLCFNPHILFFPSNQDISPLCEGNGNGRKERDSFQGETNKDFAKMRALLLEPWNYSHPVNNDRCLVPSLVSASGCLLVHADQPRNARRGWRHDAVTAKKGGKESVSRLLFPLEQDRRHVARGCGHLRRARTHARDEHRLQRETLPLRAKDFARGRLPSNSFRDSRKSREFSVLEGCIFLSYPFDDLLFFKGRRFFILFFAMILIVRFNF